MKLKKVLIFLLVLTLSLSHLTFASDIATDKVIEEEINVQDLTNAISVEMYSLIYDEMQKNGIDYSEYGGSFIDSNNNLVVQLTDQKDVKKYSKILNKENQMKVTEKIVNEVTKSGNQLNYYDELLKACDTDVIYVTVKNSKSDLVELKEKLLNSKNNKEFWAIAVNDKQNNLSIFVNSNENKATLLESLDSKEADICDIVVMRGTLNLTATYNAYGGRGLKLSSNGDPGFTLGFNAKNSSGDYGIVTCGHAFDGNHSVYYENGKKIGTVDQYTYGTDLDAAWIPFSNTLFTKWEPTDYYSEYGSSTYSYTSDVASDSKLVIGARVERYGITSGKTVGTIEYVDYSGTISTPDGSSVTYVDALIYSNAPSLGDSGGPVVLNSGNPKSLHYIAAVNSGYLETTDGTRYGIGSKANDILSEYGLTAVTSGSY